MRNLPREFGTDDPGYSITGWPKVDECDCGARAAVLCSTFDAADYECRGTPVDPRSAYGPDRCGAVFERVRADVLTTNDKGRPG